MADYGVHSEVGKLRKVIVHRPGLALSRLTPSNREELLFDDVIWVKQARVEHHAFVDVMRERGIEVFFVRKLLEETVRDIEARKWLLDRRVRPEIVDGNIVNIEELDGYGPFLLAAAETDIQGRPLFPATYGGGILCEPDSREPWFVSASHDEACLSETLDKFRTALAGALDALARTS